MRHLMLLICVSGTLAQAQSRSPVRTTPGGNPGGPAHTMEGGPAPIHAAPRDRSDAASRSDRASSLKTRDTAFEPHPRLATPLEFHPGTRVVVPPAWDRCTAVPDTVFWGRRDLFNEIQWMSRKGLIPITQVGPDVTSLRDVAQAPSGWKAYGVAIPPGGQLNVELAHPNLGWFRLMAVRKDGTPGPGMLKAMVAYRPVAFTLTNPTKEAGAVYVIVDDPGWMSSKEHPYTLTFTRSWDPATVDLSSVKFVVGIWGASPSVSAEFQGPSLTGPAVFPH